VPRPTVPETVARLASLSYPARDECEIVIRLGPEQAGLTSSGRRANVKYMVTFHIRPENIKAAIKRFMDGEPTVEGAKIVGRWHEMGTGS
jgi:hypothetical protein